MANEDVVVKARKTRKGLRIGLLLLVVLIGLWWGVPTYRKIKADALVDELCKKDGGITVHETVKLPVGRFDKYGNVNVPFTPRPGEDYYLRTEKAWVVPYSEEGSISISRQSFKLYRATDRKLLGEAISYLRRGGDAPSHAHPSSYRCPNDVSVSKQVFFHD